MFMDIEKVKSLVFELLGNDETGHGIDHIKRVLRLSLNFADIENADKDLVTLIALLHDVDDYKLFGMENAKELVNAKKIMNDCEIDEDIQEKVCEAIKCIGYSKRLKGITPTTIEGCVVADADMCDALGASGIIRTLEYGKSHGRVFFDPEVIPIDDINADSYIGRNADTGVCHMFEKILRLRGMMLTSAGMDEASRRHQFNIDFLYQLFDEEDCPDWKEYLDNYLEKNKIKCKK